MISEFLLLSLVLSSIYQALSPTGYSRILEDVVQDALDSFRECINENSTEKKQFEMEFTCPIYNVNKQEWNQYVDFKDGEGYFVMNEKRHIVFYQFDCDIPEIRALGSAALFDGRSFFSFDDGELCPIYPSRNEKSPDTDYRIGSSTLGNTAKVEYGGLTNYLYSKYGVSVYLDSYGHLSGLSSSGSNEGYNGYNESVYVKGSYGEGNCGIVSISNALSCYSNHGGKSYLPSYDSLAGVSAYAYSTHFAEAIAAGYSPKSSTVYLHSIYAKVREYAIYQGYSVANGMDDSATEAAFLNTLSYYGYQGSFVPYTMSETSQTAVINEISNNRPFQFIVLGDKVYGGHGMMATGYRVYRGTMRVNRSFYIDVEFFCISVFDGDSSTERWIDADRLSLFPYGSDDYRSSVMKMTKLEVWS